MTEDDKNEIDDIMNMLNVESNDSQLDVFIKQFHGKVTKLGGNRIKVEYDFRNREQMEDWQFSWGDRYEWKPGRIILKNSGYFDTVRMKFVFKA